MPTTPSGLSRKEYHRNWYLKNRSHKLAKNRAWRKKNSRRMRELTARWYQQNRTQHCKRSIENRRRRLQNANARSRVNEYQKLRRIRNETARLQNTLSARLHRELKGTKTRTVSLLGCSIHEFRVYIQSLFKPGMSWKNYGRRWELDHIRPVSSFDLSKPRQQKACFRWSNFQPLWAKENRKKGNLWQS